MPSAPIRRRPQRLAWLSAWVLVFAWGYALPALGQTPPASYLWADADAQLHTETTLAAVPEPYRSAYAAQRAQAARAPVPVSPAAPAGGATDAAVSKDPAAQRAHWQGQIALARAELLAATQAYGALDTQVSQLSANPILRLTPVVRAQVDAVAEPRAKARKRLDAARAQLITALPNAARAAGVPPAWLQ